MTIHETSTLLKIVEDFVHNQLMNRYEEHVSNKFLIVLILRLCAPNIKNILGGDPNAAYHAVVPIFEGILELQCKAISNGHHVAQYFQQHVEKHLNPTGA